MEKQINFETFLIQRLSVTENASFDIRHVIYIRRNRLRGRKDFIIIDEGQFKHKSLCKLYHKIKNPVQKQHIPNSDIYENIIHYLVDDDIYKNLFKFLTINKAFSTLILTELRKHYFETKSSVVYIVHSTKEDEEGNVCEIELEKNQFCRSLDSYEYNWEKISPILLRNDSLPNLRIGEVLTVKRSLELFKAEDLIPMARPWIF
jgi:predicted CopG family antitoxin